MCQGKAKKKNIFFQKSTFHSPLLSITLHAFSYYWEKYHLCRSKYSLFDRVVSVVTTYNIFPFLSTILRNKTKI